jgi:hypothetical protein
LVIPYLKITVDTLKIKNKHFLKFILIRGIDTIKNVFINILYYTKNVELTYYHCQKSYYYYNEFIEQITDEKNMFLQLTSRDATTYVYKKTIYEIIKESKDKESKDKESKDKESKDKESKDKESKDKCTLILEFINIFNAFIIKLIEDPIFFSSQSQNGDLERIEKIGNIFYKMNNLNIDANKINDFHCIIFLLNNKISDIDIYVQVICLLVKKINKNINLINIFKEKIYSELNEINNYQIENGLDIDIDIEDEEYSNKITNYLNLIENK